MRAEQRPSKAMQSKDCPVGLLGGSGAELALRGVPGLRDQARLGVSAVPGLCRGRGRHGGGFESSAAPASVVGELPERTGPQAGI